MFFIHFWHYYMLCFCGLPCVSCIRQMRKVKCAVTEKTYDSFPCDVTTLQFGYTVLIPNKIPQTSYNKIWMKCIIKILDMFPVLMFETRPNMWFWVHSSISQMSLQHRSTWTWTMHGVSFVVLWISAWNRKMGSILLWRIPTNLWFDCMIYQTTPLSQTMKMQMMMR